MERKLVQCPYCGKIKGLNINELGMAELTWDDAQEYDLEYLCTLCGVPVRIADALLEEDTLVIDNRTAQI